MAQDVVIVLDCGATNVRAIAVDTSGKVVAKASMPNLTLPGQENESWHVWPLDAIFEKFSLCSQQIMYELQPEQIRAITVTTFGVDGTLVDSTGNPLYPVISWKCPRTSLFRQNMKKYLDPEAAVLESGVGYFAFNTINKLIWFKENHPDLLQKAHAWVFISSLFNHRLTGRLTTDATMAGTSQLTSLQTQQFSRKILNALALDETLFPPMVQAGEVIGTLLPEAARMLHLPDGIPVISTGHDTQFAVYGSGAGKGEPVLSSGTWEILMARTPEARDLTSDLFDHGFTCEWDAAKGCFNPGIQWLASGVVEWISQLFYPGLEGDNKYRQMIQDASAVKPGCHDVQFDPSFLPDRDGNNCGAISGLSLSTSRGMIYRAALEALAEKLNTSLKKLEAIGGFNAEELILVGGGSKNGLWNQIKANTLQLPIKILKEPETTVLGAAMFASAGAGLFATPDDARNSFNIQYDTIYPE